MQIDDDLHGSVSRPPTTTDVTDIKARRASIAGFVGTVIEYYDFSIYGFLTIYFATLFFPNENPAVEIITALAVFGSAYIARPLGGVVLGWYGDRVGRMPVLLISVIGVGVCAGVIGLMPTYEHIGLAAPILVVLVRLVQGFCAGGEVMGALTYVAESSPARKRGFFSSLTVMGSSVGFALAAVSVGVMNALVDDAAMASWGWRIPFLVCIPLSIGAFLVRRHLSDSMEFAKTGEPNEIVEAPVVEVLRNHAKTLLGGIALAIAITGAGYVGLSYMPVYLVKTLGFEPSATSWVVAGSIVAALVIFPIAGRLSDQIGRRRVFIWATSLYAVLAYPIFMAISIADNLVVIWLILAIFMMLSGMQSVGAMTLLPEVFPAKVRMTGSALSHNLGIVLGGAFAGFICAQLVRVTGSAIAPAYFVIAVAIVGLGGLVLLRDPAAARIDAMSKTIEHP
ncbi:MFS transporter [Rhodococcus sp. USK13]|uniref:MFS transporter n=1 Tax=Rhodococcus sp. USK13 TaxID=2806442 RepID=UPI001BD0C6AD|nr:MFS transporter [Rhodococcus sp. USK13]